jgi:LCP family protein required for cell wall assembly
MHGSTPGRDRAGEPPRRGRSRDGRAPASRVPRQRRPADHYHASEYPAGSRDGGYPDGDYQGTGYQDAGYQAGPAGDYRAAGAPDRWGGPPGPAGHASPGPPPEWGDQGRHQSGGYGEPPEWHQRAGWDARHPGWEQQAGWDQPQPGYAQQAAWDEQARSYEQAGWEQPAGWPGQAAPGPAASRGGRVYGGEPDGGFPPGAAGSRAGTARPAGMARSDQRPRSSGSRPGRTRGTDPRYLSRRDGRPRRSRRAPRWALVTVVVGTLLSLVGGGSALAATVLMDRYAGGIQKENLLGSAAVDPAQSLDGPINMLLLGIDGREAGTDNNRSDTIIVLHVPSTHDQAYLISVPRDTWVAVPGYWEMKITEAFYHGNRDGGWTGGAQLVAQSLHQLTGLSFNAAGIVNFSGFEKIIDEMGGIEFCVETAATSEHLVRVNGERMGIGQARRDGWHYEPVRYEPGCQQLAGWQALDYVRQRKNLETDEGDYARQRHQQQLLQAMAKKATSADVMTNLGTLDRLLRATGDALILDTNQVDLASFAFTIRNVRPGDIVSLRTNDGWYNSAQKEGVSAELLNELSVAMFRAAANDTMAQFLLNHPDVVNG